MNKLLNLIAMLLLSSGYINANEVSKERWMSEMSTILSISFCKPNWYFMKCFNISKVECEETATSATRVCLKSLQGKFPDTFHSPKEGKFWGTKVGECAGRAYEVTLLHKRISNQECNDPSNWNSAK